MLNDAIKALVNHYYKPTFPTEAVLYITNKCNLKCGFCDIGIDNQKGGTKSTKELTVMQIDRILSALREMRVGSLYITGGEPFLARNIWYLLEQCIQARIIIGGITTNGSILGKLTPKQRDLLSRANVKRVIISIDHADPRKHDAFRGRTGLFKDIDDFLRSPQSKSIKTKYCVSAVISKETFHDLSRIVEWSSSSGNISHITFQPVCVRPILVDYETQHGTKDLYNVEESDFDLLKIHLDNAVRTAAQSRISTTLPFLRLWIYHYFRFANTRTFFFERVMKGFVCSKPYNFIHINYNGDLLACTHVGPYGNIADSDISTTWRLHAAKYKKIFEKKKYFAQCRNCFCDFAANYRYSLIYRPISNAWHVVHMMSYYAARRRLNTK